uniref:Putative ixodes 26 kDa salivary protein n=1 Tax=Ixodes ricinus TaxID=34613 RepID=A0A0K8RFM6_IXORI
MKAFIGVLAFASFVSSSPDYPRLQIVDRNMYSPGKKNITIAYLLQGFPSKDATPSSEVGKWLMMVQKQAETELTKKLDVPIFLETTRIKVPGDQLSHLLSTWVSSGYMHADTVLEYLKTFFRGSFNPDIICLVTEATLYNSRHQNYLGYSKYTNLCKGFVPMLLHYNNHVKTTGVFLSDLIQNSISPNERSRWSEMTKEEKELYLDGCNIRYKERNNPNSDEYHPVPIYKDELYKDGEVPEY